MSDEQRTAWGRWWPRVGARLAYPGEPIARGGCIPDTKTMWDIYAALGGFMGWMQRTDGEIQPYVTDADVSWLDAVLRWCHVTGVKPSLMS